MIPSSLLAVLGLAAIHLFGGRLRFLNVIPRSRLLSLAGGMAVAYVFLRILPSLEQVQRGVGREVGDALHVPNHSMYVVALAGLIAFYGLERVAEKSRKERFERTGDDCPGPFAFWVNMLSYAVVNFLVGYLLLGRELLGRRRVALFFLAMALWFVVNDHGLRVAHRERYHRVGRWLLMAALLAGWGVSLAALFPPVAISLALAFVGGGVILNVLKEELPRERESRFWAFAVGAAGYSALLLVI